jgi:hypothetical protein
LPQAPQFDALVLVLVSQPFDAFPSQLPKPALQLPTPQTPALHAPVAFAGAQSRPQPPQCDALVLVLVSQPLAVLPSQLPKPALQAKPQVDWRQTAAALLRGGHTTPQPPQCDALRVVSTHTLLQLVRPAQSRVHTPDAQKNPVAQVFPHAPQWLALELVLVSQPFDALPSQLPKPALQLPTPQAPPAQAGVALGTVQAFPHAPQWLALVPVLVSHPFDALPSQLPKPALQFPTPQAPEAQVGVAFASAHAAAQRPQFEGLVSRLVSQPLRALPSQSPQFAAQLSTTHAPALQPGTALGREHRAPQPPQWFTSPRVSVSQPLVTLPSQLPHPAPHVMPQAPPPHEGAPLTALHTFAQRPQCDTELLVLVSQPLAALPSQSPKPALQLATVQAPALHPATPLAAAQPRPHAPQCDTVVRTSVSQPLAALPSQLPHPPLQVMPQTPAAQVAAPLVVLHALPQAPQCAVAVPRLVSQPLAALPSQSPKPTLQRKPHMPPPQVGEALARAGHELPQPPQFAGSVRRSKHCPAQKVSPVPQTLPHAPPEHTMPVVQPTPQAPQWAFDVRVSVSQPLVVLPSQLPKPALQLATVHAPPAQPATPLATLHARPQAPQLDGVARRSVSHPLRGSPSQSPKPALQLPTPHAPARQAAVALGTLHTRPQAPQCAVAVLVLVSQPLAASPSQSPKPALHDATPQRPPAQLGAPLATAQDRPQAPQLPVEVPVLVSQPLAASPSQFPNPGAQVMPQAPDAQVAVPFALLHARPQAPQLVGATRRSTSQPLAGLPSQSPKPTLQAATVHRPEPQAATALGRLHAPPQRPQCAVAVLVLVSQPLATLPSQSPKPAAQVMAQAPARHDAAPFVDGQALPQRPQWEGVTRVSTSQPLMGLPSQSEKPALHEATPQRPPAQVAVALGRLQAAPQAPQCEAAASRSVSQPLASLPSQSPRVVGAQTRVDSQRPAAHRAPALGKEQAVPHAPQCRVLTRVSTSQPLAALPSQSPKPAAQVMAQAPALHDAAPFVDGHALPQRPQCAGALRVSTSQPLAGSPSQSAKPGLHEATPQRPAAHAPTALGGAQAMPQPPQLRASARASTSQPLVGAPSQSAYPSAHIGLQRPAAHTADPLAGRSQRVVQVPQWSASVRVSTSQPLRSSRSQFANPGAQTIAQRASAQEAVALGPWGHDAPQAPQCDALIARVTSQPLVASPSQSAAPASQRRPQVPSSHTAALAAPAGQALSQRPQ